MVHICLVLVKSVIIAMIGDIEKQCPVLKSWVNHTGDKHAGLSAAVRKVPVVSEKVLNLVKPASEKYSGFENVVRWVCFLSLFLILKCL